jgi:uncharacterized protein YjbI with pentapeptide repeats
MTSILSTSGKLLYSGNETTLSKALSNAISAGISLHGAYLHDDDLNDADLVGADLSSADLSIADLSNADLRGANLSGANLSNACLCEANLRSADLRCADLCWANLSDTNLNGADLSNSNLSDANLIGANLIGADFSDSTGLYIPGVARSMQVHYKIVLVKDTLFIGCRHHKLHEWFAFSDETINKMDGGALKWWRENKAMLYTWSESAKFGIKL